ncbi:MAG: FAD-binding protein [Planctomycetaceae bacterium]|jgi:succinate dehydrogenase/fumarate reductase flavoprotein subunit|nr:FAD-binding protein [Planctomycetaceae bacterium]
MRKVHTLIIGSGAAGLCAAVRLRAEGVDDLLIATEGLDQSTSINTGSDKQTYYKLSLCGNQTDSPYETAQTLFENGSMHGDIALVEAALSARAFFHLVNLGVRFPTDRFGQFAGYKTDHDPRQHATSVGPYTSRDMCIALIKRVKELQIPICEHLYCVELLKCKEQRKEQAENRICGAIFLNDHDEWIPIIAENIIFAVGGPGGLYEASVYPSGHKGGIGLALAIGAEAQNLPESQFGIASTKFRWNVSGTYMQVIPKFVSTDQNGSEPREFLREYFDSPAELHSKIFLKGYQWPFDVRKVIGGSSLIDILVYIETVEHHRRVFLDYRENPQDFSFDRLLPEAYQYLKNSGALLETPVMRLEKMNPNAVRHYGVNGIDLHGEMLEIAVCAQHNNGGLAGTIWWESTNIKHFFPIGEVNGSHGVMRPGGSALNSGQVGAFRAAEFIANRYRNWTLDIDEIASKIRKPDLSTLRLKKAVPDFVCRRMSQFGGMVRRLDDLKIVVKEAWQQFQHDRNPFCLAHAVYLDAIFYAIYSGVGSRGSGLVIGGNSGNNGNGNNSGKPIHCKLDGDQWSLQPENEFYREKVLLSYYDPEADEISHYWEQRRPIPETDLWFETIWQEFQQGKIYRQ